MEKNIAVICYHKNAKDLYAKEWIDDYRSSIEKQIGVAFDIFETCYGGNEYRIFKNSIYEYKEFPTFVHCMNAMITDCFNKGYKAVANTNVDDWYSLDRLVRQWPYIISGFDIIASDFSLIIPGRPLHRHNFSRLILQNELYRDNNIICHPSVMYSEKFWKKHKYDPTEIPKEDFMLWKRAIKDSRIIILPFNLIFHRVHDNAVSRPQQKFCIR